MHLLRRNTLQVKTFQINHLPQCLVWEVNYENKKIFIVTLYWSPSQTDDECDGFLRSLESVINSSNNFFSYFLLITGHFYARSSSWWEIDINNFEGISFENLTLSNTLKQLISQITHLLPDSSSCIGLIFTYYPNMVKSSSVLIMNKFKNK